MQAKTNLFCFEENMSLCGLGNILDQGGKLVQQVFRFSWDHVIRNVKGQHSEAIRNYKASTKDGLLPVKNKENKESKIEPRPNLNNEKVDKFDNIMEGIKLDGGTNNQTQDIQNSKVVGVNGNEKRKMDRAVCYPFNKATDKQIDRELGGRMVQVLMQDHGRIRLGHTKPVDMVPLGCNRLQSLEEIRLGHIEPVYEVESNDPTEDEFDPHSVKAGFQFNLLKIN